MCLSSSFGAAEVLQFSTSGVVSVYNFQLFSKASGKTKNPIKETENWNFNTIITFDKIDSFILLKLKN